MFAWSRKRGITVHFQSQILYFWKSIYREKNSDKLSSACHDTTEQHRRGWKNLIEQKVTIFWQTAANFLQNSDRQSQIPERRIYGCSIYYFPLIFFSKNRGFRPQIFVAYFWRKFSDKMKIFLQFFDSSNLGSRDIIISFLPPAMKPLLQCRASPTFQTMTSWCGRPRRVQTSWGLRSGAVWGVWQTAGIPSFAWLAFSLGPSALRATT